MARKVFHAALASEHVFHSLDVDYRNRWANDKKEANKLKARYVEAGAFFANVIEDGGVLGRYRITAHFKLGTIDATHTAFCGGGCRCIGQDYNGCTLSTPIIKNDDPMYGVIRDPKFFG